MSTATSTRESAALESGFVERVQASGAESHPEVTGAGTDDMSPLARRIAYLTLLAGVLFPYGRGGLRLVRLLPLAKSPVEDVVCPELTEAGVGWHLGFTLPRSRP
jgi:hypothetical protein